MAGLEDSTPSSIVQKLVHRIPPGRAASYGTIARAALALGRPIGGARTVAWILASLKGTNDTPWHRVVGAGGVILLPDRRGALQISRLRHEGVRFFKAVIEPRFLIDESELLATRRGRQLRRAEAVSSPQPRRMAEARRHRIRIA